MIADQELHKDNVTVLKDWLNRVCDKQFNDFKSAKIT